MTVHCRNKIPIHHDDKNLDVNRHNALLVRIGGIIAGELDSCVRIADAIIDCVLPQCLIIFGDLLIQYLSLEPFIKDDAGAGEMIEIAGARVTSGVLQAVISPTLLRFSTCSQISAYISISSPAVLVSGYCRLTRIEQAYNFSKASRK